MVEAARMREKSYAIIGCQHAHIEIFIAEMQELGYTCKGIYEPDNKQLAGTIAEKYGIPLTEDKLNLLDDETVQIIGCAAINSEKIDVIELCEQYGKHVMADKPVVTSEDGLKRLTEVIERGKIQVGMLLTERFHPAIYTVKQAIDQGELGEIVSVTMRKPHKLNASLRPDWFFDKQLCGGIVIDLFVHDFDLLRWFTGKEISRIEGYAGKSILPEHPSFYNTAAVQVLMEDGNVMQLYADWHMPQKSWTWGDGRIFITGTKGAAELRLAGDPAISADQSLLFATTHAEEWRQVAIIQPPVSISEDFLNRLGLSSKHKAKAFAASTASTAIITHDVIWQACRHTIEADQAVQYMMQEMKEGVQA